MQNYHEIERHDGQADVKNGQEEFFFAVWILEPPTGF